MSTLTPVLNALGLRVPSQQVEMVQRLHKAGCYGSLPEAPGALSDGQAAAILHHVPFDNTDAALDWLAWTTQKHMPADPLTRQIQEALPQLREALKHAPQEVRETPLLMLDPAEILADPAAYQFRRNGDAKTGATHKKQAASWDPVLHGDPLLVHQRDDGKYYVADGHHRLELAQRLKAEGKGPEKIAAYVLDKKYSVKDARLVAAYKNLVQGHAGVVEAAQVLLEAQAPDVHKELLPELPQTREDINEAYRLASLVAEKTKDGAQQSRVLDIIRKRLESRVDAAKSWVAKVHPEQPRVSALERLKHDHPDPAPSRA